MHRIKSQYTFFIYLLTSLILVGSFNLIKKLCVTPMKATQTGYAQVDHSRLFYQKFGAGDPIVILHGQPLDQSYLLPQMLELAKDHEVIFYDQRGSGKSLDADTNHQYITIDEFTNDLEKLRITLKLKKFVLIGHSFGSLLAINYTLKYPEHISGLILLSSGPTDQAGYQAYANEFNKKIAHIENKIQALFNHKDIEKLSNQEIMNLYRTMFSRYFYNTKKAQELTLNMSKTSVQSSIKAWEQMSKIFALKPNTSLFPKLKSIKIPTLIIHGNQDVVPTQIAQKIKDTIPNSKIVYLDKCGHFPFIEKPKELFAAIEQFLKSTE